MASRNLLHKNKLQEFRNWAVSDGWTEEPCKGDFEIMRLRNPSVKSPIIIFKKLGAKEHLAVNEVGVPTVMRWLKLRNRK